MMKDELKIRTLTERFFEGETTLEDERELYACYQAGEVPEDLLPYREMFMDFDAMEATPAAAQAIPVARKAKRWHHIIGWSAAACLATITIIGAHRLFSQQNDEYVAVIYGKKCTDKAIVMAEVRRAVNGMAENASMEDDIAQQLNEMFKTE